MQRGEPGDHATLREAVRPYGKSPPGTVRGSCDARWQPAEEEARAARAIEPLARDGQFRWIQERLVRWVTAKRFRFLVRRAGPPSWGRSAGLPLRHRRHSARWLLHEARVVR